MSSKKNEHISLGAEVVEDLLVHYGVKGMKWGVRRDRDERAANRSQKKLAKADKKFEQRVNSPKTFLELHNRAADKINQEIPEINASFEKKYPKEMNDGTLFNESHPVTKEYSREYNRRFVQHLNTAAQEMGTNPSGTRRIRIESQNEESFSEFRWGWKTEKISHSADEPIDVFVATRDDAGRIISIRAKENVIEQGELFVSNYLAHYGVKGMKWGVRRDRSATDISVTTDATKKRTAKKIQTKGGQNLPAHPDAIGPAVAKQKLKKSGPAALSNQELRELANRMQLEQQVKSLDSQQTSGGKKFVTKVLKTAGEQQAQRIVNAKAAEAVDKSILKKK